MNTKKIAQTGQGDSIASLIQLNAVQNKENCKSIDSKCRYVKATLYHLDGRTSDMILLMPIYTLWLEPIELARIYIESFVSSLTRHWVHISHFETQMGTMINGEFSSPFAPMRTEIPLGKVYIHSMRGSWVSPGDVSKP